MLPRHERANAKKKAKQHRDQPWTGDIETSKQSHILLLLCGGRRVAQSLKAVHVKADV